MIVQTRTSPAIPKPSVSILNKSKLSRIPYPNIFCQKKLSKLFLSCPTTDDPEHYRSTQPNHIKGSEVIMLLL